MSALLSVTPLFITSADGVGSLGHAVTVHVPGSVGVEVVLDPDGWPLRVEDAVPVDDRSALSSEVDPEHPAIRAIDTTATTTTNQRVMGVRPAGFMARTYQESRRINCRKPPASTG